MSATSPDQQPSGAKCPICGRPPDASYRPFCSRRCADIDLARWLKGRYAIPGEPAATDEDGSDPAGTPPGQQKASDDEDA